MAARRNRDEQPRRDKDGQALSLFAEMLKKARHKAGLNSDELGEKIGYAGATIRSVESGHRVPSPTWRRDWTSSSTTPASSR
jgi:ribosome-binding protein aMBF1 (putative translation factor)